MSTQPIFSSDQSTFDFSDLPLSPLREPVYEYGRDGLVKQVPEASNPAPGLRKFLPWIAAQVAIAIGLGTCFAQAMAPIASKKILINEINFPLRLNNVEIVSSIPSSIQDGFHFRVSPID